MIAELSPYEQLIQDALTNPERLRALERTALLDSPPEAAFDRITVLAGRLLGAPVTLVSLIAHDRQFYKSAAGMPPELAQMRSMPLSYSFCKHVVASGEPLVVEDTRIHPLVCDVEAIRAFGALTYLGIPLNTPDQQTLGTLCALGSEPRKWTPEEVETLSELAAIAMTEVALRLELRRQAELQDELRESEERYRGVVDGINNVVFTLDPAGRLGFVNRAWADVMDQGIDEAMGRPLDEFFMLDEDFASVHDALRASASKNKPYTTYRIMPSGSIQWLEIRMARQHADDAAAGLIGIITDVSDSYRVEAEREARHHAERHLRLKESLLSNLSHELRTPLAAIMSGSEILREEVGPEQRPYADFIYQGGSRLLLTLDTMLLYAQAESGNAVPTPSRFELVHEVRHVVDQLGPGDNEVRVEGPETLTVQSDRIFVVHVLQSVIGNALKFTSKGQVHIRLGESDGMVEIDVADTGIGIPTSYMPRLFMPFEQAGSGASRPFEGCGLGLALSKELMTLLGGAITAESEEGKGTIIRLRLPNQRE